MDPIYLEKNDVDIALDENTWVAIINASLGKFHGLIGQSFPYELEFYQGLKANLKIMNEDKPLFINSFSSHTFNLDTYYGGSHNINCFIRVNEDTN